MEDAKLQALHDTLSKLRGHQGLGLQGGSQYSWQQSHVPNHPQERHPAAASLPNNLLYATFLPEGVYDPKNPHLYSGGNRVIKRDFSDCQNSRTSNASDDDDVAEKKQKKDERKAAKKRARKEAKLEEKRQRKLQEKREQKRIEKKIERQADAISVTSKSISQSKTCAELLMTTIKSDTEQKPQIGKLKKEKRKMKDEDNNASKVVVVSQQTAGESSTQLKPVSKSKQKKKKKVQD